MHKGNGPDYISDLFESRILRYNLRNSDHNLTQPSYNNRYYHNSFSYKASHLWNQLSSYIKRSTELSEYRKHLRSFNLTILRTSCFQSIQWDSGGCSHVHSRIYYCYLFWYIYDPFKLFFIQMHCIFIDLVFLLSCVLYKSLWLG